MMIYKFGSLRNEFVTLPQPRIRSAAPLKQSPHCTFVQRRPARAAIRRIAAALPELRFAKSPVRSGREPFGHDLIVFAYPSPASLSEGGATKAVAPLQRFAGATSPRSDLKNRRGAAQALQSRTWVRKSGGGSASEVQQNTNPPAFREEPIFYRR